MKVFLSVMMLLLIIAGCAPKQSQKSEESITYGISPYQDTILPVVAEKEGWYKEKGLSVNLKVLEWGDVMSAIASHSVDVAIQNFNSFQASAESINEKGGDVIFYCVTYIFKGVAIMVRPDGKLKPLSEYVKQFPHDKNRAILETVKQLQGKTVLATRGTETEQIVLEAMDRAHLKPDSDVKITHAQASDNLAAFLRGEGDCFSGGLTERTEAARHGAVALIEASDLEPPVLDGLVTTRQYALQHPKVLKSLIELWFKTIQYLGEDLEHRAPLAIDYLSSVGSTKYTTDEYKYTWFNTEVYFKTPQEVERDVMNPHGNYYWKNSWDANNQFLLKQKKITSPIPYDDFWGEKVEKELLVH